MAGMLNKISIEPGTVFHKWTVLRENPVRFKDRCVGYFCRCECGKELTIRGSQLRSGRSRACQKCSAREWCAKPEANPQKYENFGSISGSYFNHVEANALRRSISFQVTIEDMDTQWIRQSGKCALTGWELDAPVRGGTASLDRIDSQQGYRQGNIQWLHKDVNRSKHTHGEKYFIKMCQEIVSNLGGPNHE